MRKTGYLFVILSVIAFITTGCSQSSIEQKTLDAKTNLELLKNEPLKAEPMVNEPVKEEPRKQEQQGLEGQKNSDVMNEQGRPLDKKLLIERLDKNTDESIRYIYNESPNNITVESIHNGSFTAPGKSEILVIFKLLNMPHAGGLDCSVVAVYDRNSLDIVTQKTFPADDCKFSLLKDDKDRNYLLFIGSTTYQGYSDYLIETWEIGRSWRLIFPENQNTYNQRKYKFELKDNSTILVSRSILGKAEENSLPEMTWMREFYLTWNKVKRTFDELIPQTYTDRKGIPLIDAVSKSPDNKCAICTHVEETKGEYQVLIYDTVKNSLMKKYDLLARDYGFQWAPDSSKVCVTRAARIWQELSIIDIKGNRMVELPASKEIINKLKADGVTLGYTLNHNRPDPSLTPVEWSPDSKSILVFYQWTDNSNYRQNGTFVFDVETQNISRATQNPPDTEGGNIAAKKPEGFQW